MWQTTSAAVPTRPYRPPSGSGVRVPSGSGSGSRSCPCCRGGGLSNVNFVRQVRRNWQFQVWSFGRLIVWSRSFLYLEVAAAFLISSDGWRVGGTGTSGALVGRGGRLYALCPCSCPSCCTGTGGGDAGCCPHGWPTEFDMALIRAILSSRLSNLEGVKG